MKTAAEIIAYLEEEMVEALVLHEEAKGKDAHQALAQMLKAVTIEQLLDGIKN